MPASCGVILRNGRHLRAWYFVDLEAHGAVEFEVEPGDEIYQVDGEVPDDLRVFVFERVGVAHLGPETLAPRFGPPRRVPAAGRPQRYRAQGQRLRVADQPEANSP